MWRLVYWVAASVLIVAFPSEAKETSVPVEVMIGTGNVDPALIHKLQDSASLPVPLVFVNGVLRGLLPVTVDVPIDAIDTRIEVGVPQLAERPLYTIDVRRQENTRKRGILSAMLSYPELVAVPSFKAEQSKELKAYPLYKPTYDEYGPTLGIKRIIWQTLETDKHIILPAAPYEALVDLASRNHEAFDRRTTILPIIIAPAEGKGFPPIGLLLAQYGFDIAKLLSDEKMPYRSFVVAHWAAVWLRDPSGFFRAPEPDELCVMSKPSRASIYINAMKWFELTNAAVSTPREVWSTIVVQKDGYEDCPFDSANLRRRTPKYGFKGCNFKPIDPYFPRYQATFMCQLRKRK
jgi:hypothetical protein